MKTTVFASTALTLILSITATAFLIPINAQEADSKDSAKNRSGVNNPIKTKRKLDTRQLCPNRDKQPKLPNDDNPVFYKTTWGNNPQEGQYRKEMERLLKIEISNVRRAIHDIETKHEDLIHLYPSLAKNQVITLEDIPGVWRNNEFVNSKKLIIFHYNDDKKLDCIVLDSMTRNIYNDNQWTRKLLRLYYPNVQSMEMETLRHNYNPPASTLDRTSPEVQLTALRFVFLQLRTALYTMDMMIAAYYDKRNKLNYWQIDL